MSDKKITVNVAEIPESALIAKGWTPPQPVKPKVPEMMLPSFSGDPEHVVRFVPATDGHWSWRMETRTKSGAWEYMNAGVNSWLAEMGDEFIKMGEQMKEVAANGRDYYA